MADLALTLGPGFGEKYLKLVKLLSSYKVENQEYLDLGHKDGGVILVCWHNRLLGAIILHANKNLGPIISQSRDGEIISRVVERLGYSPIRGSTTRGGGMALLGLVRHVKKGFDVVVTPDGPKGPRYQVQDGAAYLAMTTGFPVVAIGVGARRKVVFRSWDRFQLPLPFGKVQVVYGKPLKFSKNDDLETVKEAIRDSLMTATLTADELLGVVSP